MTFTNGHDINFYVSHAIYEPGFVTVAFELLTLF